MLALLAKTLYPCHCLTHTQLLQLACRYLSAHAYLPFAQDAHQMRAQVILHAMPKVTHFVSVHNLLYEHHNKSWSTEHCIAIHSTKELAVAVLSPAAVLTQSMYCWCRQLQAQVLSAMFLSLRRGGEGSALCATDSYLTASVRFRHQQISA